MKINWESPNYLVVIEDDLQHCTILLLCLEKKLRYHLQHFRSSTSPWISQKTFADTASLNNLHRGSTAKTKRNGDRGSSLLSPRLHKIQSPTTPFTFTPILQERSRLEIHLVQIPGKFLFSSSLLMYNGLALSNAFESHLKRKMLSIIYLLLIHAVWATSTRSFRTGWSRLAKALKMIFFFL